MTLRLPEAGPSGSQSFPRKMIQADAVFLRTGEEYRDVEIRAKVENKIPTVDVIQASGEHVAVKGSVRAIRGQEVSLVFPVPGDSWEHPRLSSLPQPGTNK